VRLRAVQNRAGSLAEAIANVVAGYVVALLLRRIVYPLFGITSSLATDSIIAGLFTATSLVRSYVLRRVFEALGQAGELGTGDART
jgi:hypothetical protein